MRLSFDTPSALTLLLAVLCLALLSLLTLRWQRRTHAGLAEGSEWQLLRGATSSWRRTLKIVLALLALSALALGAAGPYQGHRTDPLRQSQTDLMVVLDVSQSMLAQDVTPSRFDVARRNVEGLLNALDGDCAGLVIFGGRAVLRAPCTLDYEAVRSVLRATAIDSAPLAGSSLAEGLRTGLASLRQSTAPRKAILLVTDGEDSAGSIDAVLPDVIAANIRVFTIATGTVQGGPIPTIGNDGRVALKRDKAGQVVTTRLSEDVLRDIAAKTGGSYMEASALGTELRRLYDIMRGPTPELVASEAGALQAAPAPLTAWISWAALLLLVFETVIAERGGGWSFRRPIASVPTTVLAVAFLAAGCATTANVTEYSLNRDGLDAYGRGEFKDAASAFQEAQTLRPDAPELSFNIGAALYEDTQHDQALAEWERTEPVDETLQRNTEYNQGNTLFRLERYEDAAEAYKRVLRANPDDMDAKVNLELTLEKLKFNTPEEQQQRPVGTPREIPLGDADAGPQGNQPQPPMRPSDGQSGPEPRPSQFPPQAGGPVPPDYRPEPFDGQQPQQQESTQPPVDPIEAMRQAIVESGLSITEAEALRILEALRLREPGLQERYNNSAARQQARPEQDW